MDVRLVGPSVWTFLHAIPFCIDLEQVAPLMEALTNVLPCKFCRESLSEYLAAKPVQVEQPIQFAVWLWQLHNAVNVKLDKPTVNVTSTLAHRLSHADMTLALEDFLQVLALNYPEQPDEGDKIKYRNFFQVLSKVVHIDLQELESALESRDQLFGWVLSAFELADQRTRLETLRVVPAEPPKPQAEWLAKAIVGTPPLPVL